MARRNYLVEGLSGAGKSSVYEELVQRGYTAISTDRAWSYSADPDTGLPGGPIGHDTWMWDRETAVSELERPEPDVLFVCGSSRNRDHFLPYFAKVFNLRIDDDTMRRRLQERTQDDWSLGQEGVELMLELNRSDEGPAGAIDVDATHPLSQVVDELLRLAGIPRSEGDASLRVLLEIGPKGKRIVAAAMDWPGLERSGRTEHDAVDRLRAYVPRYAPVAERVGLRSELERGVMPHIVERTPGNTSTDWWGIAHVPSVIEAEPLADDELERRIGLMQAAWDHFDDASEAVAAPLTKGPRGGGRERDQIIRHVYASERHNFWRKVGIREDDEARLTPEELAALRERYVAAIREHHTEGRPARRWPLRFLIRRTAQHAMDHAWELEDRDPG